MTATPDGKTQKEKNRNLKELLQMTVALGDQQIPIKEIPFLFDWKPNASSGQRTPVRIFSKVKEQMGELTLPPVIITPHIVDPLEGVPTLSVPSNVMVKGDLLNVYTNQQFTPGEKFVVTDARGQRFTLQPKCMSAQQAVIQLPDNIVPGEITVSEEVWNQPVTGYAIDKVAKVMLVDISLSSPNTNLRPGQESFVLATISGLWEDHFAFCVDLRNLNPNIVTMEGGNLQRVNVNNFTVVTGEAISEICWQYKRNITGNAVGSFSVSATLHEDYSTSNDPFRPQLDVLKTQEDFNTWATALKKDLKNYSGVISADVVPELNTDVVSFNAQRAIDNMPVCTSPEQLDESKAVAYSLIQPLNVPKGAANTWLSSFDAFKSLITSFSGREEMSKPFHFNSEIVETGLDFMERISYRSNDPTMTQDVTNARQLINTIKETVEMKEDLAQLDQALSSLSSRTDQKMMSVSETSKLLDWSLSDMGFSTYCFDKRTKDGIDPVKSMIGFLDPDKKILRVKHEYQQQVLNSLNALPLDNGSYTINAVTASLTPVSYNIQVASLVRADFFDSKWWEKYPVEKETDAATLLTTTKDETGTVHVFFKDAKCNTGITESGRTADCTELQEWDEKEQKFKPTGKYTTIKESRSGRCRKGTDFCTEVYVITKVINTYLDAKCTRLIKVETKSGFSCL
ncbi:MAG: hypothetical protein HZB42_07330 [Sphingobacteriales bacterium]|nr:hypothetical protein [Sphingobacteriales bacterium]